MKVYILFMEIYSVEFESNENHGSIRLDKQHAHTQAPISVEIIFDRG